MGSDCSVLQEHLPFAGLTGLRVDLMRERERGDKVKQKRKEGEKSVGEREWEGRSEREGGERGEKGEGRERHRRRDREPASVIKQT